TPAEGGSAAQLPPYADYSEDIKRRDTALRTTHRATRRAASHTTRQTTYQRLQRARPHLGPAPRVADCAPTTPPTTESPSPPGWTAPRSGPTGGDRAPHRGAR